MQRKPHALSGGQRQRVALGRAIVRDPKVFLFDEPLSNLDAALRVSTRGEIAALHRRLGATMIYVTHDQVEAMTLGTRICIMNKARVVQVGTPLEVYRKPANTFVAGFLGNPPMNLIPGIAVAGGGLQIGPAHIAVPAERASAVKPGEPVVFGIRPENVGEERRGNGLQAAFETDIVQVERLGAETIVVSKVAGLDARLVARNGGDIAYAVGERRTLFADLSAAHVFDSAGNAL
ncbi:MAG: ABC transporter ATP-binding protein [Hyphomicrobiaceae bacterium]